MRIINHLQSLSTDVYSIEMDVTVTHYVAEKQVKGQPREDNERDRRSMGAIRRSREGERVRAVGGGRKGREGMEKEAIHPSPQADRQTDGRSRKFVIELALTLPPPSLQLISTLN